MPSPKILSFGRYAYSRKKSGDMTSTKIKSEMCNYPNNIIVTIFFVQNEMQACKRSLSFKITFSLPLNSL